MKKFKKTVLPNGIRVVTEFHPSARAVSMGIWVLTGTRDETPHIAGVSHLLEHLTFKGTKTRSSYQIAKSLESLGGDLNAFTSRENTCYQALVLKDDWPVALDVLSDLVTNMKIDKKDFKLEKGVVLQEIAMSEENHEEVIYDLLYDHIYKAHPLGRPIAGTIKSVAEMKLGDVHDYYKKYYTGSNLIVSAAGNIDHQEFIEAISAKMGAKKKFRLKRTRRAPRWNPVRCVFDKKSEQAHILISLPVVGFKDSSRFESYIINSYLGGGMTSKLYQSVRERRGLAYSIYSYLNTYEDCGQLNIYAAADPENVKELVEITFAELRRMAESGIRKSDVELFKKQVIGGLLLGSDDPENRMSSLAINEMVFGEYRSVDQIVDDIKKIDEKKINLFIRNKMKLGAISGALLGPGVIAHSDWWKGLKV